MLFWKWCCSSGYILMVWVSKSADADYTVKRKLFYQNIEAARPGRWCLRATAKSNGWVVFYDDAFLHCVGSASLST
jgi:hypothetical protein